MSRLSIQIHNSDQYNPLRAFFVIVDDASRTPSAYIVQDADDTLVSDLRAAADGLEAQLAKDRKKAEIEARVKAEMDAEAVA